MTQTWGWTPTRRRILAALVDAAEPMWPLDLSEQLGISYGTTYDTLRRIYDLGWVVGVTAPALYGPPRVHYRLTAQGREHAPALLRQFDNDKET